MRVSMMVRWSSALAVIVFTAACADTATAPPKAASQQLSGKAYEQWLLDNGGVSRDGRGRDPKTTGQTSKDFVVDPTQPTTIRAGNHVVYFPANSICDPATSGYGENMWDAPCTPLQTPITIHATWSPKLGHAFIDFQPALRFVPTSDPSQYVTITMQDDWDLDPSYHYPIYWLRPADSLWVDESINDASEWATNDVPNNKVTRRLKHFSGYMVGAGEICDAWSGGSCGSVLSFAGYMLGG
jgi:hypothetical protein